MKENVILVDFKADDNWEFSEILESITHEKWRVHEVVSNKNQGGKVQNIVRYMKYFLAPVTIAIHKNRYSKVLAWQQFYGLILAFYLRLFRVKNTPQIVVMTFIYKPKKSLVGRVYNKFIRYIVTSGYINSFIVFSESEKLYYSELFNVAEGLFVPVRLGCEDVSQIVESQTGGEFYLAAGRSNRDYDYLINSWKNRTELLEIICDSIEDVEYSNIKILTNCYGEDFLRELSRAYAVIIPLEDSNISSGQLVAIQAMIYGKPVIATRNDTICDYIKDNYNGLIIDKTQDALNEAISKLEDKNYYNMISINGRKSYEKYYSMNAMARKIGELLKQQAE